MIVRLTAEEIEWCRLLGAARNLANLSADVTSRKKSPQSDEEINVEGVYGELALSFAFNIPSIDTTIGPRRGGYDLLIHGRPFDVKATHYGNGHLIAGLRVNPDVDFYELALVHALPDVNCPKWAAKPDLIQQENLKDFGWGPCYALKQDDPRMHDWKQDIEGRKQFIDDIIKYERLKGYESY